MLLLHRGRRQQLPGQPGLSGVKLVEMAMKKFQIFIVVLVMTLATILVGGCSSDTKTTPAVVSMKTVRIGTVPLPFYSHMWVAHKKGFLAEELSKVGFTAVWKPINLGPVVSESFAAGEVDMGVMGDFPAFVGRASGIRYTVVSASDIAPAQALLAGPKSTAKSVTDLKGKKVATTKNTSGHELLAVLLEKEGLTLQDVQFVNMSMADSGPALINGDIDAVVVWEPSVTRLEENGAKVIKDGKKCPTYAVLLAGDDFLKANPAAVEAVNKAYARGVAYLKDNPEECLKLLSVEFKITEPQLKKMIVKYQPVPLDDQFVKDMNSQEAFLRSNKIIKNAIDMKAFIHRP